MLVLESWHEQMMRFARQVVSWVQSQLNNQINIVEEQVATGLRAIIEQIVGGVWIGRGADAFVEEVSNLVLPEVGRVGNVINTTQQNISHAVDTIDRADEQVTQLVNGLADLFANIYH